MHIIPFDVKRAFWSGIAHTRVLYNLFDLTAARFDMLYAIDRVNGTLQSDLRRKLGVCAPVASRMSRLLEALGYVTRTKYMADERQILVKLTPWGREQLDEAIRFFHGYRMADRIVARMLCPRLPKFDPQKIFARDEKSVRATYRVEAADQISRLDSTLTTMRESCGDRATLHFPWHPDD